MKRRIRFKEKAKRQRRGLFTGLFIVLLISGCLSLFVIADDGIDEVIVTADSGDTLWDICASYAPEGMDVRNFIAKVKYINGIKSSALSIGQEIKIPLKSNR